MSSSLAALLAGSAAYTVRITHDSDPTVVKPVVVTTSKANVKSEKLVPSSAGSKSPVKVESKSAIKVETDGVPSPDVKREGSTLVLLQPGLYDARRFMMAWRHSKNRDEQITALSGYKGYDLRKDFGSQEINALFYAKHETVGISPGADRNAVRSAQRTAQGYVAGMPHPQERLVMDLQARERSVLEMMSAHLKVAQDESKPSAERSAAATAIREGEVFLRDLRAELSLMGFESAVSIAPETAPQMGVRHEVE